jgi:hypothetical protein
MANKFLQGTGNSAVAYRNNPNDWYPMGVEYVEASNKTKLNVTAQLTSLGYDDAELNGVTGDVRKFIHAIVEHLYLGYANNALADPTNHGSDNFKMAKATSHDPTNNNRMTTYTIFVKEDGEVVGESSYSKGTFNTTGMTSDT